MKFARFSSLLCLAVILPLRAGESLLKADAMRRLTFDQRLDATVSLDLEFIDEDGQSIQLKRYFGSRPAILTLGYYQCPMLCNLVLNGIVESLQEVKPEVAGKIHFIFVSVDPTETPELARAKKQTY